MTKFDALPPSEATTLLSGLVGERLLSIQRIVRYPIDQMAKDLNLPALNECFRVAPGEVFFGFESGQCIRISSDAHRRTVLISSAHTDPKEEAATPDYLGREGVLLFADDAKYSDARIMNLLGKRINDVGVIFVDDGDSRSINQRGIAFYAEDQKGIILGLQLRESKVAHLSFLEFDDLNADLRPFLRQTGIGGKSLPC